MYQIRFLPARLLAVPAALLLTVAAAADDPPKADLAKIDRAVAKEPAYQGEPRYCLLVFGHEAKTRVWLVQDGDVLYVDRNANGDLTEDGERVPSAKEQRNDFVAFQAGDLRDGNKTHTKLVVTRSVATQEY